MFAAFFLLEDFFMTHKLNYLLLTLLFSIFTGTMALFGTADASTSTNTGANFTVTPVYPSNQVGGQLGYFQLKTTPRQTGTIGIKISNYGSTNQNLTVTPTKATTNDNGQIEYVPNDRKLLKQAQSSIPQLMSAAQTVTIPAKSSKTITFDYTVPKQGFRGMLLGGFYVLSNNRQTGQNTNVINRYAMVVGISMSDDSPNKLVPRLSAGKVKVSNNGNNTTITTPIKNTVATYFRKMTINTTVTKKGHSKVLYHKQLSNGSMAPTSYFNYSLPIGKKVSTPGHYVEHIRIKENGHAWSFNRSFAITALNTTKQAVHAHQLKNVWWIWALIIFILVAIIGGFFYWLGSRRNSDNSKHTTPTNHKK